MSQSKRYGLKLTFEGAPATPHTIGDVPGHFVPGEVTPVGEAGEVPLEVARKAAKEHDALELVEIQRDEVKGREEAAAAVREEVRTGIRAAARDAEGSEVERVRDEQKTVKQSAQSASKKED